MSVERVRDTMARLARRWGVLVIALMLAPRSVASAQEIQSPGLPSDWRMPNGVFAEPALLRKVMNASDGVITDREGADGPYAALRNMVTGAGWISAGPGYRRHELSGRALVDASAAVSSNLYKVAQARFELQHLVHDRLALGAQATYQDLLQVNYFGLGENSLKSDRSAYRFNNIDILAYGTGRATTWLSVTGRLGWLGRPDLSTATGRHVTVPNTIDLFSETSAPGIRTQSSFLHGDASMIADWRDHAGRPTRGGLFRATAAAYSDRDQGTYSFRRYELEASHFVPVFSKKWILALHGWEVFSDTSTGGVVPFYLMPSLGGQNTLRGYDDYRFHDNHMQSFNAESRWSLFTHIDVAAFVDAGKVTARAGDLDFTKLRTSFGAGIRMHNAASTLARLDVGHSVEGWHVFFKISDPLNRSTPASGRAAVVPFVP